MVLRRPALARFCRAALASTYRIGLPESPSKGKKAMAQRTHLAVPVSERDHIQGPDTATVTLVQYGDYECPYTRRSTWVVQAIQQQLGDQLRFVYRNFPLTEIHPHALTLVITGLLSGGMWLYASSGGRLLAYDLNRPTFRFSQVRSFLAPTLFLLSAVVALWNP